MCNKLCNCLFSDVLAKRPALDAWSALAGIRPSRVWTVKVLWTGRECPESGRLSCSGQVGGVQSLDVFKLSSYG